ncbi:MAG: hypothetical protein D9V47_14500 [Clostridia bacterium]|nr:MAG: hypothetical protein D9V47_14500 [Clostridia bacterium]
MVNRRAWEKRQQQWERFNRWEVTAPEAEASADLQAVLSWFSEAWELAAYFHPDWRAGSLDRAKVQYLVQLREALPSSC